MFASLIKNVETKEQKAVEKPKEEGKDLEDELRKFMSELKQEWERMIPQIFN